MAVYNVELRRSNGSNYEDKIYLKTSVGLVEGLLDENDKIRASLLPDFVFGSMRFVTALESNTDITDLHDMFNDFVATHGGSIRGCYAIATSSVVSIGNYIGEEDLGYLIYTDEFKLPVTDGEIDIEANDWLICISDDGKTWAIINNTYRDATTIYKGIVQLATEQDGINGTSGTLAMTPKATVAAINARAYSHPTYLTKSFHTTSAIITNLEIKNGHIQSMSSGFINYANESDAGLIRLASSAEAKAAETTNTAISPVTAKEMIDKFASIPIVQSLPTDMSDHPEGKLILLRI